MRVGSYIEAVQLSESHEFHKTLRFGSVHSDRHADDVELFFQKGVDLVTFLVSEQPYQLIDVLAHLLVFCPHHLVVCSARPFDNPHPGVNIFRIMNTEEVNPILHFDFEAVLGFDLDTIRLHHIHSQYLSEVSKSYLAGILSQGADLSKLPSYLNT